MGWIRLGGTTVTAGSTVAVRTLAGRDERRWMAGGDCRSPPNSQLRSAPWFGALDRITAFADHQLGRLPVLWGTGTVATASCWTATGRCSRPLLSAGCPAHDFKCRPLAVASHRLRFEKVGGFL